MHFLYFFIFLHQRVTLSCLDMILTLAVPAGVISGPTLKNLKICLKYFVVSHFLAATCIPYE